MAAALYPQVVLDKAPHQVWVARLLENVLREFALVPSDTDSALFEKTFDILLQQAMQERNRGVEHSTIAQEHVTRRRRLVTSPNKNIMARKNERGDKPK